MRWLDDGVQFHFGALEGDEASWAHLYGANSSIKRRFLERVGGYDEERLPYLYEDIDWGYRAREHGLRVLYNRRAIVDHWRPMSLDVWKSRAPMLAATEWQFCQMHPDVAPWFHQKFSDAISRPRARGRGAALARFVPKWLPWLGEKVWFNADVYWRQQIAPHFLTSWDAALAGAPGSVQPDVAVLLAERSGPK
jgi:GT2 family glycosyltransferase